MKTVITFTVNDGSRLTLSQEARDAPVILSGPSSQTIIPPGEFVQLCNLYRYIKRYDLADAFINPRGRYIAAEGGYIVQPGTNPGTESPEAVPLWFYLWQDGNGGIHLFRRPLSPGEDPTAVQLEIIDEHEKPLGGALLAAWPASQFVEAANLADIPLDAPAPEAGAAPEQQPAQDPGPASP